MLSFSGYFASLMDQMTKAINRINNRRLKNAMKGVMLVLVEQLLSQTKRNIYNFDKSMAKLGFNLNFVTPFLYVKVNGGLVWHVAIIFIEQCLCTTKNKQLKHFKHDFIKFFPPEYIRTS